MDTGKKINRSDIYHAVRRNAKLIRKEGKIKLHCCHSTVESVQMSK